MSDETWNFKCPSCGQKDRFKISGKSWFLITPEGAEDHQDVEYDELSLASCTECTWSGLVMDLDKFRDVQQGTCVHCKKPIRTVPDGRWVHDDPDEDPDEDENLYGWVSCAVGDTIATPSDEKT